ncbi:MAG: suppressor of fused domain protein [Clostridiales bacterium]|nr:suppressor of fused domain protein [Clostridiales bacterium]
MSNETNEYSENGQPIYRHTESAGFQAADTHDSSAEAIVNHFEENVGKVSNTFHEIVSDKVHIDVHFISPCEERDYYTLFTTGMSDRPMNAPAGCDELRYAELLLCLPKTWPMGNDEFKDENNYWPVRWLKFLARLPHEYNTWLCAGHTVPNGDPAEPFSRNTQLCCLLLNYPSLVNDSGNMGSLKVREDKIINFYSVMPIYDSEMNFKLKKDTETLIKRFNKHQINELLNVNRLDTCKNLFFF